MKRISVKITALLLAVAILVPTLAMVSSAEWGINLNFGKSAEEIIESCLVMKVDADNYLVRGETEPIFESNDGTAYGAPYKDALGNVMVPLLPVLDYLDIPYRLNSSGYGCDVYYGSEYRSIASGRAYVELYGKITLLSVAPAAKTIGENVVLYIGLDDVELLFDGYYVTYDSSGMIFISEYDEFINRRNDSDEELIKATAKRFIFSELDFRELTNEAGQKLIYDYRSKPIKDMAGFVNSFYELDEFKSLYTMFQEGTNNFTHPYILTNQSRFDELHYTYLSSFDSAYSSYLDEELVWYIETQIKYADSYLKLYANINEDGEYVDLKEGHWNYDSEGKANTGGGWSTEEVEGVTNHSVAIMPYQGPEYDRNPATGKGYGQGYDPAGGRLNVLSDGETALVAALEPAALAYQITRDEKYLEFAYDWMVALCSWEHWGPGHYLNCTNTARPLATAYDWLYNDFVRVYGQDAVDALANRIYENAVHEAIVTLTGNPAEHYRYGDSSRYWAHVGNWNSCGASGMLIASLAVLGNEGWGEEYMEECLFVISASLGWYMDRGLTYITLDGGYRESAGYWGAVRFMHTVHKVLVDTAGTDFGLSNYPGMDTADYFGAMMESSAYKRWNYHDDWEGTQPSNWYYLSAQLYDNPEYAAIRYEQIHSGNSNKAPHRYDVLYYNKELVADIREVEFTLDYSLTTIDATIVRDSWEKNSIFAGLMGGYNNVAHGQYDSGNWIYENQGVRWFVDLGADNYNLYGGGLSKGYYKYSAEGNNTIAMESLPHGQLMDSKMNADTMGGQLISFNSNEYGSSTIIDQKTVYGDKVEYAYRGMLFTNSRSTFIIQDEVKTVSPETLYWFAHYNNSTVKSVKISDDGRTAYMQAMNPDKEYVYLRVSLVSDNSDLKFEIMDTYTYVLSGTPSLDYSPTNKPGIQENNRDKFSKLVVKAENVTELNMAVVIETVEIVDTLELGYTLGWEGDENLLRPMDTWVAEADPREYEEEEEPIVDNVTKPTLYEIISVADDINVLMEKDPLGKDRAAMFVMICKMENCFSEYGKNFSDVVLQNAVATYEEARRMYDEYRDSVAAVSRDVEKIAASFVGIGKLGQN